LSPVAFSMARAGTRLIPLKSTSLRLTAERFCHPETSATGPRRPSADRACSPGWRSTAEIRCRR
jgi:hypothetical protein